MGERITALYKIDHVRQPGEPPQDDLLIRDDKNPNTAGASERFARYDGAPFDDATDLLLVWGEGFDFSRTGSGPNHSAGAWQRPENAQADVFIPISIQTERRGHYTNFQGTVSASNHASPRKTAFSR